MTDYPVYFFCEPNIKLEIMLIHFSLYNTHFKKIFVGEHLLSFLIVIADSDKSGFFVFLS